MEGNSLVLKLHEKLTIELQERKKELRCLYDFARLIEISENGIEEIGRQLPSLISRSFQFPEKTGVMVRIGEISHRTETFRKSTHSHIQNIIATGKTVGGITVKITGRYKSDPILPEEYELIEYLAERMGRVIERLEIKEELEKTKFQLQIKNTQLEQKNSALSEILEQMEKKQKQGILQLQNSMKSTISPLLDKLMERYNDPFMQLLRHSIDDLFEPIGSALSAQLYSLTMREVEICRCILRGMQTKQIGETLGISSQTVNKHRFHIRKKLKLTGAGENLFSYLSMLRTAQNRTDQRLVTSLLPLAVPM